MLLYKYDDSGITSLIDLPQEILTVQSSYNKNHMPEISGLVAGPKIICFIRSPPNMCKSEETTAF